jgi:DNA-binding transcriptional LysR family regulator
VAFVRRPVDDPTLLTELVAVDDVVAALPDNHPLAARPIQGEESVVVMAWREDRRTPVVTAFMHFTREIAPLKRTRSR